MRRNYLPFAVCCSFPILCAAGAIHAEEPYTAYIHPRLADVRSGPTIDAYVTDRLGRGAAVEVYTRSENGWLGIRPTADQFSLVRASSVEVDPRTRLGEVVDTNTKAWVGSDFADPDQHDSYVTLKEGEVVQVIGKRNGALTVGGPTELLYEIEPPAGEFRWVRASQLRRRKPRAVSSTIEFVDLQSGGSSGPVRETTSSTTAQAAIPKRGSGWQSRTSVRSSRAQAAENGILPAGDPVTIDRIHADIAKAIQGDASSWELSPLRQRCEALMKTSRSMVERGQARIALARIEEFEELQAKKLALRSGGNSNMQVVASAPVSGDRVLTGARVGNDGVLAEYDGVGILVKVNSPPGKGAPQYALKSRDDKIVAFVNPAPGLNLDRYKDQEVGVFGQRGYIESFRDSPVTGKVVTAERVVDLGRHRR